MIQKEHSFCYTKCKEGCICKPTEPPRCGFGCGSCNCPYCLDKNVGEVVPSINDLNCDNCDLFCEQDDVQLGEWVTVHTCGGTIIPESMPICTRLRGCASHPLALRVLGKPVVKKLEEVREREESNYRIAIDASERTYRKGKNNALSEAVSFFKGVVEK